MKTYKIECDGEVHEIGLDDEGYLHALDHSDHEMTLALMGEVPESECIELIIALENADKEEIADLAIEATCYDEIGTVRLIDDIVNDEKIRNWIFINAAELGYVDIMKLMFDSGLWDKQHALNSSLIKASEEGEEEAVQWLLSHGADKHYLPRKQIIEFRRRIKGNRYD